MGSQHRWDVVVVGAGLAGIVCAALIARAGKKVLLVERARHAGGRARSRVDGGFTFDLGPHALYRAGAAERALASLGIAPKGRVPPTSGAAALVGKRAHALPTGLLSLATTGALSAAGKLAFAGLLARLDRLDARALDGTTARAWLDAVRAPDARALLEALVRVGSYSNAPDVLDAGAAVRQLQRVNRHGVLYLDGGWQRLVDDALAIARVHGVAFAAGAAARVLIEDTAVATDDAAHRAPSAVAGVATDGAAIRAPSAVAGVAIDGATHRAPSVVLAMGARDAAACVPEDRALAARAQAAVASRAAVLQIALDALPIPERRFAVGVDTPHYFSVPSATARLAPDGAHAVNVARYLAPGETATKEELEAVMDLAQPGWRAHVRFARFVPELVVASDLPRAGAGGLAGRAPITAAETRGLLVAGDWVGPEGMLLDAALASAAAAADALCQKEIVAAA